MISTRFKIMIPQVGRDVQLDVVYCPCPSLLVE